MVGQLDLDWQRREKSMNDVYTHGHHESVLRSHRARTAENSAAYLLPHLRAGMDVLDVGCGPGTITTDLARIVAPGRVTGIDRSDEVVGQAAALASGQGLDVRFRSGDVYALDMADEALTWCTRTRCATSQRSCLGAEGDAAPRSRRRRRGGSAGWGLFVGRVGAAASAARPLARDLPRRRAQERC
jgi:SAM-dependent methyltransferase